MLIHRVGPTDGQDTRIDLAALRMFVGDKFNLLLYRTIFYYVRVVVERASWMSVAGQIWPAGRLLNITAIGYEKQPM